MYALSTSAGFEKRPVLSDLNPPETNWNADPTDNQRFRRNLDKRTGRPKLLKLLEIILKSEEIFIRRVRLPSMIWSDGHGSRVPQSSNWCFREKILQFSSRSSTSGARTGTGQTKPECARKHRRYEDILNELMEHESSRADFMTDRAPGPEQAASAVRYKARTPFTWN